MRIDASLANRLLRAQFPQWAHLPVAPVAPGGWDNRTFRLGERLTVRLPAAARYAAQVRKEQRWLPKLTPLLPLPIPEPVAMGVPGEGYPAHWSVYRWIEGERATIDRIDDLPRFARELAHFLAALQAINPAGAPAPGRHNFFRGGPLATYDEETRNAIAALADGIDASAATAVWERALGSSWRGEPVWVHGDASAANLLVRHGRLSAVIDFGCSAAGDPACDLTIAWTFFAGPSRKAFRTALPLDDATWARARGWALWKALITLARRGDGSAATDEQARRVVDAVLAEPVEPG